MNKHLKRKYSLEERRDYYLEFKRSGMRHTEFCRASGISKAALYAWKKEFQGGGPVNFSPLMLTKPEQETDQNNGMISLEIRLANQVQLHVRFPKNQLVSFTRELNHESAIIR